MKQFNVLDRNLVLHQHYLLEASAGTGKTFSIQNIVVRLLIEPQVETRSEGKDGPSEPLLLQKILVVTFTRAATRDLKMRIRSNIEQALSDLQSWQSDHLIPAMAPDYLKGCMERGEAAVLQACKRLQQALFTFDYAPIFTIHSFCARMLRQFALESDMGLHSLAGDEALSQSEVMEIIRDFFRTGIRIENYSPAQLEILLKEDPCQRKLMRLIQGLYSFPSFPPFKELYLKVTKALFLLKSSLALNSENLISDFKTQASAYRNHKGAETKIDTLTKVIRFAKLFDREEWSTQEVDGLIRDGLIWLKALDPHLLKGKPPNEDLLHYPTFSACLRESLAMLIHEAGDFPHLLARLGGDCQKLLRRFQREEEKLSHDDVLRKMHEALDRGSFLGKVRAHYQAAIIDEFQDTDPLQWQIFSRLFLSDYPRWKGYLYLVGDPKQSIYSFRQADIYTYLEAAKAVDRSIQYDPADAISTVKKLATAKFDETIEGHIKTGCDGRHADQQIRGAVVLPHGTGKQVRVLVFAKGAKADEAVAAGAEFVGAEELIPRIQNDGWFDYDVVVATPDMMGVVGRLGRVLGPKGLMPNPKAGTVTMDVTKAVQDIKAGKIEYRLDKTNIIHVPIGKASFTEEQLADNFQTLIDAIVKAKPAAAKGQYFRNVTITSTMGPGVKIDTTKFA